jgi:SpoVK/Ycf46/Vps4 family AAA+-type ATPase
LDISYQSIKTALNSSSTLFQSGLVKVKRNTTCDLQHRLKLMDGLGDALIVPDVDIGEVFNRYFSPAKLPKLSIDDYGYIDEQVQLILRYLSSIKNKVKHSNNTNTIKGINILLYGTPGSGKSELAAAIATALSFKFYEITMTDDDGDPIQGEERFSAFRLAQQVLNKKNLIVFDEIEDVFPTSPLSFMDNSSNGSKDKKAWINRLLENNEVPTIWISNEVEQIDDAYKRRFKFALKMENPPEKTRLKIIRASINTLPVTSTWMENLAKHPDISPAIISQTADIVTLMHSDEPNQCDSTVIERDLTQILNNSLELMEKEKICHEKNLSPIAYNIDAINPDINIKKLVKGLNHHQVGRLCLYGPPGTGKTAFGYHVASELGKKLLIKRASDLLDMYVGQSEKNIAQMFEQAKTEDAVLLLDEADSFLRDRKKANQSWQITQVNELLTQMEAFQGIFICSTNLMGDLDEASIRRFDLKIKLNYMKQNQVWNLFRQVIAEQGNRLTQQTKWKSQLSNFHNLTPGDFVTVIRQNRLFSEQLGVHQLFEGLKNESEFKKDSGQRSIGFAANF